MRAADDDEHVPPEVRVVRPEPIVVCVSGTGGAAAGPTVGDDDSGRGALGRTSRSGAGAAPDAAVPPRPIRVVARSGLAARGLFYFLLAGLAVNLLVGVGPVRAGQGGGQANANGALTQVANAPLGFALLAAAALGFAVYGLVRLIGAATDGRHGPLRRLSTAGQALLYFGMAYVTSSFLLGRRTSGSEQQQHGTAAKVIALPFGRVLLGAVGLVVLAMCAWQLIVAARGHFADTLREDAMGPRTRRLTLLTARIGIPARALAIVPVGVFLVVAAVRADPGQAKGLDALLLQLSRTVPGRLLGVLAAAGFAVFAVYSLLEARYRQVASGA